MSPYEIEAHELRAALARMTDERNALRAALFNERNALPGSRGAEEKARACADNAALLERIRVADRMRSLAQHDTACDRDGYGKFPDADRCATCAYDALTAGGA